MPNSLVFMRVFWYNFLMKTQEISVENLIKTNKELTAENERLRQQIQWLMQQIRRAKPKQFGASSEHTDLNQVNLFNEVE